MTTVKLPVAVLKSPAITGSLPESNLVTLKNQVKFQHILSMSVQHGVNEMHQNRMKNLRKDLEYLKSTEWKHEPIEKFLGQYS